MQTSFTAYLHPNDFIINDLFKKSSFTTYFSRL